MDALFQIFMSTLDNLTISKLRCVKNDHFDIRIQNYYFHCFVACDEQILNWEFIIINFFSFKPIKKNQ